MSTNKELFGDSSSSSDDDDDDDNLDDQQQKTEIAQKPAKETDAEEALKDTAETKKDEPKSNDLDDSDDDEPEFDDQGAVVGLKSTTLAGTQQAAFSSDASKKLTETDGSAAADNEANQDDARPLFVQEMKNRPSNSHVTKLPNIIGIQTEAFDPDEYSAAQELQDFGQAAFNLIRWRYKKTVHGDFVRDENDQLQRESNTRLVQWEDDTFTLHVGDEVFQVDSLNSASKTNGFAGLNGYLYLSQKASYENDEPAGTVLESMGAIQSRLTVRPSSLQSEAHKSLTVGIRQKTIKKARIAETVTHEDPEKLKQARIKTKDDVAAIRRRKGTSRGLSRPRKSKDYFEEEDDEDYDTTNIKAMKRKAYQGDEDEMDDFGDESSSDDETFRRTLGNKKKRKKEESSDEDEEMFMGDEDDDEEMVAHAKKGKKRAHQNVLDDDESD